MPTNPSSISAVLRLKSGRSSLFRSEVELRQILDAAPQFLFVLGSDGSRLYANQSVLDFRGLTVEEWQELAFQIGSGAPSDSGRRTPIFVCARERRKPSVCQPIRPRFPRSYG